MFRLGRVEVNNPAPPTIRTLLDEEAMLAMLRNQTRTNGIVIHPPGITSPLINFHSNEITSPTNLPCTCLDIEGGLRSAAASRLRIQPWHYTRTIPRHVCKMRKVWFDYDSANFPKPYLRPRHRQ
jgi:hypothetical protein